MKRILSLLLSAVLLCGCVFALASCGALSGEYKNELTGASYEFKGNKFVYNAAVAAFDAEGTYEITEDEDGDKFITLTYTKGEGEDEAGKPLPFSQGEKDGKKYIQIGYIAVYYLVK